jgi:hypothetical protein
MVQPASVAPDNLSPQLPTITPEQLATWRVQFVASHEDSPSSVKAALETWRDQGLGTKALPVQSRNAWTAELKRRVLERLVSWFAEHQLQLPADIVESETAGSKDPGELSLEALRAFIHRCVDAMTQEELEALHLSAGVAVRTKR